MVVFSGSPAYCKAKIDKYLALNRYYRKPWRVLRIKDWSDGKQTITMGE